MRDVIVVGGGPAGLATAIALALRGLDVEVREKHGASPDKACGEGVLPPGLRALDALGVVIDPAESAPIDGIRYVDPSGVVAEGRLPSPGRVVRRTALVAALEARARAVGVALAHGVRVDDHRTLPARLVVAADGLHSPIRRAAGLEVIPRGPRRFGLRQHFAARAPDHFVEVHFGGGVEAYVAGSAEHRTTLTFLFEDGVPATMPALLARFPVLEARLAGAEPLSRPRGAGPLRCAARAQVADRLVLVGDAGGYVDAITGEGLSLAFGCALALGEIVPEALANYPDERSLARYQREFDHLFRRYAAITGAVLALARHPRARRAVLAGLARAPRAFDRVLAWTVC